MRSRECVAVTLSALVPTYLELALRLVSPLHLSHELESPGGTVLWQNIALLEKAPSSSTAPLLLGFLLRAAHIGPLF